MVDRRMTTLAKRLRWADLILLRATRRQRARPTARAKGQFWGSVITDNEVDELLRHHGEINYPLDADGLDEPIRIYRAVRYPRPFDPLYELQHRLRLSDAEIDIVTLALLPEFSSGYAKIYAFLNDNLHQSRLLVDTATRILAPRRTERLALLQRLLPDMPLITKGVLTVDWRDTGGVLADQQILLRRSVVAELLRPESPEDSRLLEQPGGVIPLHNMPLSETEVSNQDSTSD